jgi:hypothetical protein
MAIYLHNPKTETEWGKGAYKVMIKSANAERPYGYCDGTPEDERSLVEMAEGEGLLEVEIHKRMVKGIREIWTIRGEGGAPAD